MKSVCLCGSFKFFDQILKLEKFFIDRGITIYRPNPFKYRDKVHPSIFIDTWNSLSYLEKLKESRQAELAHLRKIDLTDVIYVVNPSGYIGKSVTLEIGYAYAKGKIIYSQEPVEDLNVMSLIRKAISPEELVEILKKDINKDTQPLE